MTASALAIATATAFAGGANAATLDITSITPAWENVVADPAGGTITVDNTVPDISLRWGAGVGGGAQSGYDFTAAGTPLLGLAEDTPFLLGDFNHLNFPVFDPVLASVDLEVDVQIGGGGPLVTSVFGITHDETTNTAPCPAGSVSVCDDIVTISNPGTFEAFTIGDTDFVFSILGFSTDGGTTFTTSFLTQEESNNPAGLYAEFTAQENITGVPLPAAGWMLLAGIGGLAALRRRKKA
jgi:hypothetical protein